MNKNSSDNPVLSKKERAERAINEAAMKAHNAKNTDSYEELAKELYKVVSIEYSNYLEETVAAGAKFVCLADKRNTKEYDIFSDKTMLMSDLYFCAVRDIRFLMNKIENFEPEKVHDHSFFTYFHSSVKKALVIESNTEKTKTQNVGLTHIYSDQKRDPQLVKRFYNFIESANGYDVNYGAIKAFCKAMFEEEKQMNGDEEKALKEYEEKVIKEYEERVNRALVANANGKVEFVYTGMEDDDDISYSPFDCYSFKQNEIQEAENNAIKIDAVLLKINEIFSRDILSEKEKKIYSAWITALFIEEMVKETKSINKYISLSDTIENHFDDINLKAKKEIYASGKYLCIYPEVFDCVSEHKKMVLQKDIAEFFGCTTAYITKVVNEVNEMLNKEQFL